MARSEISIPAPEDSPYRHYRKLMQNKPSVPGKAVGYHFLPPRGYWGGIVKKGQILRVIDLEGRQCFDAILYDAYDLYNRLCCSFSFAKEGKWDNWTPGDGIWSRKMDKLAMITEDTSEGHHAFAGGFCSEAFERVAEGMPNMHTCHDNFVAAMRMAGFPEFSAQDIEGNDYSEVMGLGFSWSDWIKPANQAALVGHIYLGGQLLSQNPKRHGVLTGVSAV